MGKRIIYLLFIFLCLNSMITQAQAPEGINYQAVFRKPNGAIVSGQSLACEIEIVQGNISGNLAYAERHSVVTNQQGIANFVIGQGLTTTGVFSDIDWGNGPYYMKLYVDFDGQGNIFQMQQYGAQQLVSVPYALHAKVADSIAGVDLNNIGSAGLSAYEIAIQNGFIGSEAEWLTSLEGADGQDGADGVDGQDGADGQNGVDGTDGQNGTDGINGQDGTNGLSAYEIAVQNGFSGTEAEWLASLQGIDGQNGADGQDGTDGTNGLSAYEIAVQNGFVGTEAEWLASLQGTDGQNGADGQDGTDGINGQDGINGLSAYEIAVQNGFIGTEAEWLASLQGADGQDGVDGQGGVTEAGLNVNITGSGTPLDPYIIDANQTISTDGTPGNLSLNDGGGTLLINVDDADNNPTNELNTGASFNNNILEIQDAGGAVSADLSALDNSGTDDQNLTGANLNGTELQIDIEDGTSATVDLAPLQDGVDDADNDPTNELNTGASFNNNILEIQDAGGAVTADLSALDNSGTDDQNASEVFYDNTISGLGGNEVQSAIDELSNNLTTIGEASIKEFTNSDFLSDHPTLENGAWQTIAVIPGISAQNSQVGERRSYAHFQIFDYSAQVSGGGKAVELLEFTVSRILNNSQIQLINHDISGFNQSACIKIENIRVQHGKVTIGGGSVWCANIQLYRTNNCGLSTNGAETNIFVKMTNQIPLTETPLVIIPMELTSTPLSLTNITTDEINILNNNGDDVNDADSDPNNEIQDLSISNHILELSGSNQDVDLSTYLQELSFNSTNNELSISGTNSVDLNILNKWDRNNSNGYLYPINISDNVGIGTSVPSTALDVVGVLELSNVLPTDPGSDIVRLGDGGTQLQVQTNYGYTRIGPSNSNYAHFYTDRSRYYFDKKIIVDEGILSSYNEDLSLQTGQTNRMTIKNSSGNVGIGETDPDSKLEVSGRIHSIHEEPGEANLWLERWTTSSGYGIVQTSVVGADVSNYFQDPMYIGPGSYGSMTAVNNILNIAGGVAIGTSYAGTNDAPDNSLIIESQLGVGTTTPNLDSKAHFMGRVQIDGSTGAEGAGILLGGWGSDQLGGDIAVLNTEALNFGHDFDGGNGFFTQRFKMGSNGYVTFYNGHGNSSDKRLKKNINVLENSLNKVLQLEGVSYNYVPEYKNLKFDSGRKSIGFIAQDLEKVFPEIVRTDEDGLKSVEYHLLNAALVEAIKEQQSIINKQSSEIDDLRRSVEELNELIKAKNE